MFERAQASEFVSASARRLINEGTGANAPAQPVDPPPGSRPGRRAPKKRRPPADAHPIKAKPNLRYRLPLLQTPGSSAEKA